jgi:hypothetical protein
MNRAIFVAAGALAAYAVKLIIDPQGTLGLPFFAEVKTAKDRLAGARSVQL